MIGRFSRRPRRLAALLLLIPFLALLWPGLYNFDQPEIIGIPFFYWYQLAWVVLTACITAVVYWLGADS